jgi:hypothetical protein
MLTGENRGKGKGEVLEEGKAKEVGGGKGRRVPGDVES